jgi:pimeloyl-ACP methyl ester carboxylesterase
MRFVDNGDVTLAIEARGHGPRTLLFAHGWIRHDLDGYASDLRAALAAVGPAVVVAHSMGGKVAQYVATERPANLEGLVLIAPGSAFAYAMNPKHRALAEAAFGSRKRIERFQRAAMTRDVGPKTMERIVSDALLSQREAWFGWYDRGRTADLRTGSTASPSRRSSSPARTIRSRRRSA